MLCRRTSTKICKQFLGRHRLLFPAEGPQMFLGAHKQPPSGHRGRAVAKLVQRVTMQDLESVARFHYREFPGRRDAKEPPLDPYGRTEKTAAQPFLIADFA